MSPNSVCCWLPKLNSHAISESVVRKLPKVESVLRSQATLDVCSRTMLFAVAKCTRTQEHLLTPWRTSLFPFYQAPLHPHVAAALVVLVLAIQIVRARLSTL